MNPDYKSQNTSHKLSAVLTCENPLSKISNTVCLLKSLFDDQMHP